MATTEHITREETATPAVRPDPCSAVLYVCAEHGIYLPELPAARAEEEGRAYAWARGWRVAEVIHDPTTEDPEPLHRQGAPGAHAGGSGHGRHRHRALARRDRPRLRSRPAPP
ncbi:hypothetical protein ACFYPB_19700 [Streptomyces olivaceoviridis]|uniref:hypothetical protein n=1 Tax=Streptomyces olivaceoviridis TaxID=1921 RepID=UPI0036A95E86